MKSRKERINFTRKFHAFLVVVGRAGAVQGGTQTGRKASDAPPHSCFLVVPLHSPLTFEGLIIFSSPTSAAAMVLTSRVSLGDERAPPTCSPTT